MVSSRSAAAVQLTQHTAATCTGSTGARDTERGVRERGVKHFAGVMNTRLAFKYLPTQEEIKPFLLLHRMKVSYTNTHGCSALHTHLFSMEAVLKHHDHVIFQTLESSSRASEDITHMLC